MISSVLMAVCAVPRSAATARLPLSSTPGSSNSFANDRVILGQLEVHFRVWEQSEAGTNGLRDGDLTFSRDLHW